MNTEQPTAPSSSPENPRTGVIPYDPEFAEHICERIATTPQSLVKICKAPNMPGIATIFRWAREHPDFEEMIVMAKETRAEVLLEQALDIVDDDSNDVIHQPDGKIVFNRVAIQRCKMRVEHRRWLAAKLLPEKYGTHRRHREENPGPKESPATSADAGPTPEGIITEEYRMKLIEERRAVYDQAQAAIAAAAEAAATAEAATSKTAETTATTSQNSTSPTPTESPSPYSDLRTPSPDPRTSQPQVSGLGHKPADSYPHRPWTDHRPKPWYDVPVTPERIPLRLKKTINRAVS